MSDQGPGGHGGGYGGGQPPGGYGPPPGAPPGGHGQPPGGGYGQPPGGQPPGGQAPGGYGQPPGGYGQPPGGYGQPPPQGWPQQPGYGAPGQQPAPPAAKKPNPLVWVGIGCGALLFLGATGAWGVYAFVVRPLQEAQEAVAGVPSGLGASISVSDGGVSVKMPGLDITTPTAAPTTVTPAPTSAGAGTPSPTPTQPVLPSVDAGAMAVGGPSCAAAAACCRSLLEKTGATAQMGQCDQMKGMPEIGCAKALATYKKTAPLGGAVCP